MAILGRSVPNHVIISQGATGSAGSGALVTSVPADRRFRQLPKTQIVSATATTITSGTRIMVLPGTGYRPRTVEPIIWQPLPEAPVVIASPTPNALVVTQPTRRQANRPAIVWQPIPADLPPVVTGPTPGAIVIAPVRSLPRPTAPIILRTGEGAAPVPPTPQDVDFCAGPPFTTWLVTIPETTWTAGPIMTNWRANPPEEC